MKKVWVKVTDGLAEVLHVGFRVEVMLEVVSASVPTSSEVIDDGVDVVLEEEIRVDSGADFKGELMGNEPVEGFREGIPESLGTPRHVREHVLGCLIIESDVLDEVRLDKLLDELGVGAIGVQLDGVAHRAG
jgi:hypothetical protein